MALNKRRAAQVFAGMALIGLLLVSAPATACIRSHHGGMMGSASNVSQDPVVTQSDQITVEIKDYDFVPRDLTVPVGAVVTWVNRDSVLHDATHEGGEWATAILAQGERASLVFDEPGAFEYRCSIHRDMIAKLVVRTDSVALKGGQVSWRSDWFGHGKPMYLEVDEVNNSVKKALSRQPAGGG